MKRFRWVACQLDHLAECDSAQECRDALQSLPPTLNETYIRILERIPSKKTLIVRLALHAIAFVVPPLTKKELQHLLSVPEPGSNLEHHQIIGEESITRYCSSLIRQSADRMYFEFSHLSVKEFLEGGSFPGPQLEGFRISRSTSDSLLVVECLKYLLLENFSRLSVEEVLVAGEPGKRNEAYPFYLHAATRWQAYANEHWENPDVDALVRILFDQRKTSPFCSWAITFLTEEAHGANKDLLASVVTDPDFTPLHMAALLALPQVCLHLINQGIDANLHSPLGGPLQCAIQGLGCLSHFTKVDKSEYWFEPNFIFREKVKTLTVADTIICLQHSGASLRSRCKVLLPWQEFAQRGLLCGFRNMLIARSGDVNTAWREYR